MACVAEAFPFIRQADASLFIPKKRDTLSGDWTYPFSTHDLKDLPSYSHLSYWLDYLLKTVASRQEIVSLEREEQTCLNGMDVLVVLIFITIEAIVGVFQ